jgi:hypothetical protein
MIHRQRVAVLPFLCSSATGSIHVEHTSGAVVVAPTQKPLWLMLHVPSGTLLHVQAMDVPFVDIIAAGGNVAVQDPTAPGSLILVSMHGYEAAQTRTLYFANSTHDLIPVQSITRTEGNIQVLAGLPSDSITAVWEGALPGAHANCSTIASVNCTAGRIHVAAQSASRRGSFVFTVESDGSITSSQVDTLDGKSAAVAVVGSGDGVMAVHTLHDVVTVSLAEYTGQWSWAKARFNCTGGTVGVRRVWSKENTLVLALDASCPRPWLESALRWNSVATSSRSSAADVLLIALDLTAPTSDANPLVLTSAWVPASAVDAMDIAIAPRAVHVHLANTEAHLHGPEFGGQITPAFKVPGEAGGVLLKWNAFQEDDFACTGGAGVEQLATVRPTQYGAVAVSQTDEDVWPLWTMTETVPTPSWQWEATVESSCCAASAVDTTIVTVDGMERAMSLLNATCECDGSITWLASQGISSMELPRAGEIMMLVEFDVVSGALLQATHWIPDMGSVSLGFVAGHSPDAAWIADNVHGDLRLSEVRPSLESSMEEDTVVDSEDDWGVPTASGTGASGGSGGAGEADLPLIVDITLHDDGASILAVVPTQLGVAVAKSTDGGCAVFGVELPSGEVYANYTVLVTDGGVGSCSATALTNAFLMTVSCEQQSFFSSSSSADECQAVSVADASGSVIEVEMMNM